MSNRRRSRLFSGRPGLLLVNEDIPGITMPSPTADMRPLQDDEPEFDIGLFHREEDDEAEISGQSGPLRVFLGADDAPTPVTAEEDDLVFDVSALAMPSGPDDADADIHQTDAPLRFMDEDEMFEADDVVELAGAASPGFAMGVSSGINVDQAEAWDNGPTQPGPSQGQAPSTVVIRDTPPVAPAAESLAEDPFSIDDATHALTPAELPEPLGGLGAEEMWDEYDTGFFEPDAGRLRGLPDQPPRLKVDGGGESRTFRAIPDKEDPPILPLLVILIGIVVMTIALWVSYAGDDPAELISPQSPVALTPNIQPAAPQGGRPGAVEVVGNIGFISVNADKPATIYVDDRKIGITPVIQTEVSVGNHRVLAVEVETGKRKAVTADVVRGGERRVRFTFQPVQ